MGSLKRTVTFVAATMAAWAAAPATPLLAQAPATTTLGPAAPAALRADPSELGLQIPEGETKPAAGRRVLVKTDEDELVVAKVHVEVADHFAVILPDGRIDIVPVRDATITERPFVGIPSKDLQAKLVKKFPGFKVQATKHFIYVYNTSPLFYTGTSKILESLYPGVINYCKQRKLPTEEPEYPLVVVMFRTRQQWEDYMHGIYKDTGVAAFYNGATNRVLMYEQSDIGEEVPEYALKQIISTVAHEGVHQILQNIGVQQRLSRWPMWVSEGVPEYFAPTTVDKSMRWKGAGQVNDLQMKSIDGMLKEGPNLARAGTARTTAEAIVTADKLDADGYAWAWAFTHFLGEKKRDLFAKYLMEVSKIGPLERPKPEEHLRTFVDTFGGDFQKLSGDLMLHLQKLPYVDPIENMTHYVIMMQYSTALSTRRSYAVTLNAKEVQRAHDELLQRVPSGNQRDTRFDVRNFPTRAAAMNFANAWLNQ
ncbi:MAG: DUF1570 domain-containing protein [Pirellulales bacterium]